MCAVLQKLPRRLDVAIGPGKFFRVRVVSHRHARGGAAVRCLRAAPGPNEKGIMKMGSIRFVDGHSRKRLVSEVNGSIVTGGSADFGCYDVSAYNASEGSAAPLEV